MVDYNLIEYVVMNIIYRSASFMFYPGGVTRRQHQNGR